MAMRLGADNLFEPVEGWEKLPEGSSSPIPAPS
jgi:hypothetical protein